MRTEELKYHINRWHHTPEFLDMTWTEYYTAEICPDYIKGDRQRNYLRNEDLVYHSTNTKANKRTIKYLLGDIESPSFELKQTDGNFLYNHATYGAVLYNKNDITLIISPFAYMSMWVDGNLDLIADVPNVLYGEVEFTIDEYGRLLIINNIE